MIEQINRYLCAVVLTYNEAPNVRRCLESVKGFCDVFVVDSGSTDRTMEICREYTDRIFHNRYSNHASQWQWALENLPIETEWVLALDADFLVTAGLKNQIRSILPTLPKHVDGIYIVHRYVFAGREIRFGGMKKYWHRIVRRGSAQVDLSDLVDFRFIVRGDTVTLDGIVKEYNVHDEDISKWVQKQDIFSLRLAVEEELRRANLLTWNRRPRFLGNSDDRVMWLRDRWLGMPLFVRPIIFFLYRYVLRLGFLDGLAGFLYHFLQCFWLRILVDWKIRQIRELHMNKEELMQFRDQMLKSRTGSVNDIYQLLLTSKL